ncbi:MAG: hypothetical protein M3O15_02990, partial [Acidobacteriota bacterium]|nr:hypothetical protein [Acidobacteriota bacterium]
LTITQRVAPKILATFESSAAAGGGGVFSAADNRPYQNRVRYSVTSLDTRFQATSTDLLLAFHRLTQDLDRLQQPRLVAQELNFERLQMMLTQNLNFLWSWSGDWAVQLNMEVSRGSGSYLASNTEGQLMRRVVGGLAVKF